MKRILLSATLLSLMAFSFQAMAEEKDQERGKKRGGAAQGEKGGLRGAAGQRDPGELIGRMMKEFDTDGDQKLDVTELTALLKSMRERRGQMGQGEGRLEQARGRRGAQLDGQAQRGGAKPKRPE
ncbi:MAG: EF-hand domain-containing protein [Pirellulaceae bacterium]